MKNCQASFQNKSNYTRHWANQHANEKMPDGLNYMEQGPKTRKPNRNSHAEKRPANAEFSSNALQMEKVVEMCLMREPFFGEIR